MKAIDPQTGAWIRDAVSDEAMSERLRRLLTGLVSINTAPDADLAGTAAREKELFEEIRRQVVHITGGRARVEFVPLRSGLDEDPAYARPGYAADVSGRVPPASEVYRDRGNLVVEWPGENGASPALIVHAHVDVVPPWFGPRVEGQRIFGRGSADNKAQVAVALAMLELLVQWEARTGRRLPRGLVLHLTIDEEIGGNGSLALAGDNRWAGLPVLMLESSDLTPYCAHRGAVYYRCRLSPGGQPGAVAAEMFPLVVRELEAEGARIRQETRHPLFGPQHVQTSHGVLGRFGRHAGSVCDYVAVDILAQTRANPERVAMKLIEFMELSLAEYLRIYGDKRREPDPLTGRPKVERHFDLRMRSHPDMHCFRLEVWGRGGHMAAVAECDNAITKAAFLLSGLLRMAPAFPGVIATGRLADDDRNELILEGGQGFTPSHRMADVQARMIAAARRGVQAYCQLRRLPFDEGMIEMTFDRLHNDAYADSPECLPMQALKQAFTALGRTWPEPVGWTTSCDARLYHAAGHAVAIFGAGRLAVTHSDHEHVDIPDMQQALAVATLAVLSLVGA